MARQWTKQSCGIVFIFSVKIRKCLENWSAFQTKLFYSLKLKMYLTLIIDRTLTTMLYDGGMFYLLDFTVGGD